MLTKKTRDRLVTVLIIVIVYAFCIGFTVLTQIEFAPVREENVRTITASYWYYTETYNSGSDIYFLDGTSLDARWNCVDLMRKLDTLPIGEKLTLLVHQNGKFILEVRHGEDILSAYEDNVRQLNIERKTFLAIGIFINATLTFLLISPMLMKKFKKQQKVKYEFSVIEDDPQ